MHYLIDGYNFLFKLESSGGSIEKRRTALIALLDEMASNLGGGITVVFDSSEEIRDAPQRTPMSSIEVIYAPRGQSADAHIVEIVEQTKNPKVLTVVTSDGGLARQCQGLQAKTMPIDAFVAFLEKKGRKKRVEEKWSCDAPGHISRLQRIFEELLKGFE